MWVIVATVPAGSSPARMRSVPGVGEATGIPHSRSTVVVVHRVIDRERHSGRLLSVPLDVPVNLPEHGPHDFPDLVHRGRSADAHDVLRFDLFRPEFLIHFLILCVSCRGFTGRYAVDRGVLEV